jgi:hypothetical protein
VPDASKHDEGTTFPQNVSTTHPSTHFNVPEDFNLLQYSCENLKFCVYQLLGITSQTTVLSVVTGGKTSNHTNLIFRLTGIQEALAAVKLAPCSV